MLIKLKLLINATYMLMGNRYSDKTFKVMWCKNTSLSASFVSELYAAIRFSVMNVSSVSIPKMHMYTYCWIRAIWEWFWLYAFKRLGHFEELLYLFDIMNWLQIDVSNSS